MINYVAYNISIYIFHCIFLAINQQILQNVNQSWQTLANPSNTVDYSSHLLSATLPISIQHFLKYSESIKKESSALSNNVIGNGSSVGNGLNSTNLTNISNSMNAANLNLGMDVNGLNVSNGFNLKTDLLGGLKNGITPNLNLALNQVNNIAMQSHQQHNHHHNHHGNLSSSNSVSTTSSSTTANNNSTNLSANHAAEIIDRVASTAANAIAVAQTNATANGKKKKKKVQKEKKPRPKPGEIRETKALDGSTLCM